jgi:alpha-mannosidase
MKMELTGMKKRIGIVAAGLITFSLCSGAQTPDHGVPDNHPVFRQGVFDGASNEFAEGTPKAPVVADAADPDFAAQWYASQSADRGNTTAATAPRAIRFSISGAPAAAYRLHVALLMESRSLPALRICVNEHCGLFYPDSPLDARMGDSDDTFQSVHAPADISFVFPGRYLHSGADQITFQVIESPDRAVDDASLTYDAIELDTAADADLPAASASAVEPTVFYVRHDSGLNELVDVYLRGSARARANDYIQLTVGDRRFRAALTGDEDFGEQRVEFAIPEFPAGSKARLEWTIGGQRHTAECVITPKKKWTLYLVPHIHLDIGYSDYQPKVAAIQNRAMDEAMDFAARTPGFKFSVDGSWDLDEFMQTRSAADRQRAIAAMKTGQLFVPAQYAEILTGFPTAEALIRSLYMSANFSREHGTPFNYANITDVPSYSWSYASILAAAGIHYFIAGPNGHLTRAPVLIQGRLNENSPFWWVGPDGGKVLFWYGRHYWEGGILFGVPPEVNAGRATVPVFLKTYDRPSYKADAVILFGTQQENTDLFPQQAEFAAAWNQKYAYPKVQYSGFHDALEAIAQQFGGEFPTVSGDGGPYWEDGIAANAREAAMERQNESRAPSAEKLATLSSLVNPRLAADKAALDRMWKNIVLMDEHTWNSHDAWSDAVSDETARQSKVKEMYAVDAAQIADYVARNSMADLADAIAAPRGSLIVFNTLNWKRSALVDSDLERGREIVDPCTGAVVPVQVIEDSMKLRKVRFMATDVPGMGYKVYTLRRSAGATENGAESPMPIEQSQSTILENAFYRVELDPVRSGVRSIYDKQLGKELVNQESPYRFGQYLYVSGGDQRPNTLLQYRTIELQPALRMDGAGNGHLVSVTKTPYGSVARMQAEDTNTPAVATEIRLFDDEKKIEFVEDIDKTAVRTREAVYFAFPFAMDHPEFRYEIQTGVVDPAKNMYPGAGHEWFSAQHWAAVEQDGTAGAVLPLDTPLITLGDIYRGAWPDKFGTRPGTIFSFAMNNYWSTNYDSAQGGHVRLRYVVTSARSTDDAALSRMGWEAATPLELDEVTTQDKAGEAHGSWDGKQASYLEIDDPDVLTETWKPAEDGNGTILRLLDLGGSARTITVRVPGFVLSRVVRTDAVERDQEEIPLSGPHAFQLPIVPHGIATVRIIEGSPSHAGESAGHAPGL